MAVLVDLLVAKATGGTLVSRLFRLVALSAAVGVVVVVVAAEALHRIPMVRSLLHHGVRSVTIHFSHGVTLRRNAL